MNAGLIEVNSRMILLGICMASHARVVPGRYLFATDSERMACSMFLVSE